MHFVSCLRNSSESEGSSSESIEESESWGEDFWGDELVALVVGGFSCSNFKFEERDIIGIGKFRK